MSNTHSELVREFFEVIWNQRRIDRLGEFITPQSVLHADHGDVIGPEDFKQQQYIPFTSAFPDLRVELPAIIEQRDAVAVRWIARGTHSGDGLGVMPTGKSVTFRGVTWVVANEGKFGHGWQYSNIEEVIRLLTPRE